MQSYSLAMDLFEGWKVIQFGLMNFRKDLCLHLEEKLFPCFLTTGNSIRFIELSSCGNHGKMPGGHVEKIALRLKQAHIRIGQKKMRVFDKSIMWLNQTNSEASLLHE